MTLLLDTSLWIDFTRTRSPVALKQRIAPSSTRCRCLPHQRICGSRRSTSARPAARSAAPSSALIC